VTSHLLYMALFSVLVAIVFSMLVEDQPRRQVRFAALAFGAFMVGALALGWLMYFFPL
jgi:hypothetical protein